VTETSTDTGTETWTGPCLAPPTDTSTGTGGVLGQLPAADRPAHVAAADEVLDRILQGDILPADVAERLQRKRSPRG
jgi:hypothetical protein